MKWRRKYNFLQLMVYYAILLSVVIGLFTIYMATSTTVANNRAINGSLTNALDKVGDQVTANDREVREIGQHLTGTNNQVDNLYKYFELSPANYLSYSQNNAYSDVFYYLPTETLQAFTGNNDIRKIMISMSDYDKNFVATRQHPGGYKTTKALDLTDQFSFNYTFVNNANLKNYGTLYMVYQTSALTASLKKLSQANNLQLVVLSSAGIPVYQFRGPKITAKQATATTQLVRQTFGSQEKSNEQVDQTYRYRVSELANGEKIVALVNKTAIRRTHLWRNVIFLGEALLIDGILLGGLWMTFRSYRLQLQGMIRSMTLVGTGDLDERLQIPNQSGDLKTLATGINQMLDEINHYIYQIYQLQIEQQAANMKALQSQIQPHFLYNTLEYIRMYAVAEDEPELAEVVYAFAALLRNNTDQSPTTTLAKEVEFVEKYIYLYQMRFPDQIAYGVQIDPRLASLELPKFSLQPLVENYFAHGIDYLRMDNAISLKAQLIADHTVYLEVRDNGKGMDEATLAAVRAKVRGEAGLVAKQQHTTIGLRNVIERLQGYFGPAAQLMIEQNELGGVTVSLRFKLPQ